MPRRSSASDLHGFLAVDKPAGWTSHDVVARIRRLTGVRRAGHAGTLDPFATGVLVVGIGKATRLIQYVQQTAKRYVALVELGQETDTLDPEGQVVHHRDVERWPTLEEVRQVLDGFIGEIEQVPPAHSAIRIQGKRAYERARAGEAVEIPARGVTIHAIDILRYEPPDLEIDVRCGSGTYLRSLARDIGRDLGCYGYISDLRRTEVYPFAEANLVSLDTLLAVAEENPDPADRFAALDQYLLGTETAMEGIPEVALHDDAAQRVRLGNPVIVRGRDAPIEAPEAWASSRGRLLAIGVIEQGMFKPKRVFSA